MVYLKKKAFFPDGAVYLTGNEGHSVRSREQLVPETVYYVLGRPSNADPDKVKSLAEAFFRGSDVSSYTPCSLGKPENPGRGLVVFPDGALVVLRDGTRFLIDTGGDGKTTPEGTTIGSSKDIILNDRD